MGSADSANASRERRSFAVSDRFVSVLSIGAAVTAFAVYVAYTFRVDSRVVLEDQLLWVVAIIGPYEAGELSLWQALTYEFQVSGHSHIVTLAAFMADYALFDLTLRVDKLLGISAVAGSIVVVGRGLRDSVGSLRVLLWPTAAVVVASSASGNHFLWTQLQVYSYTTFVALAVVVALATASPAQRRPLAAFVIACFISFTLGGPITKAVLVAFAIVDSASRRSGWLGFQRLAVVVAHMVLLPYAALGARQHSATELSAFARQIADEPLAFAQTTVAGFSRSYVYVPNGLNIYVPAGLLALASLCFVVVHGVRSPPSPTRTVGATLVLGVVAWNMAVTYSRWLEDPTVTLRQRYATFYALAGLGAAIWLIGELARRDWSQDTKRKAALGVLAVFVAPNLVVSCLSFVVHSGSLQQLTDQYDNATRSFATDDDFQLLQPDACQIVDCDESIGYLEAREKSVFANP